MKITFLGVGGAFTTPDYYQSNILLTSETNKNMIVDCGSDLRFALREAQQCYENLCTEIDAVYISHPHADHIGGLEWLAFSTLFSPQRTTVKLFCEEGLLGKLWENSLKGGLAMVQDREMGLSDYFNCKPVQIAAPFLWQDYKFTLIPMPHITAAAATFFSYGLFIEKVAGPEFSIFITTDTQYCYNSIRSIYERASIIFHDCETSEHKSSVHAHYDELLSFPDDIKSKMWLYHYQPEPKQNPENDGFCGFIQKGQQFDVFQT